MMECSPGGWKPFLLKAIFLSNLFCFTYAPAALGQSLFRVSAQRVFPIPDNLVLRGALYDGKNTAYVWGRSVPHVLRIDENGTTHSIGEQILREPIGVIVSSNGQLTVVDGEIRDILTFDEGRLVRRTPFFVRDAADLHAAVQHDSHWYLLGRSNSDLAQVWIVDLQGAVENSHTVGKLHSEDFSFSISATALGIIVSETRSPFISRFLSEVEHEGTPPDTIRGILQRDAVPLKTVLASKIVSFQNALFQSLIDLTSDRRYVVRYDSRLRPISIQSFNVPLGLVDSAGSGMLFLRHLLIAELIVYQ